MYQLIGQVKQERESSRIKVCCLEEKLVKVK